MPDQWTHTEQQCVDQPGCMRIHSTEAREKCQYCAQLCVIRLCRLQQSPSATPLVHTAWQGAGESPTHCHRTTAAVNVQVHF